MGESVNGIRDTVYRKLASGYLQDKGKSFLYQYFWQESARELLKKVPAAPVEGPLTAKTVNETLRAAMLKNRAWARGLLLRDPPDGSKKERRDFWQELTLNDAGYLAGLITDTEYYIWLTAYLAVRDIYYKDSGPWDTDGTAWLSLLLQAALKTGKDGLTKAQVERNLKELAQKLRQEQAAGTEETAGRLHGLKQREIRNGQPRQVEYLTWLTARLKRAAIHSKIKTWLQDGGYPLRERGAVAAPNGPRKQDFSLQLFDAYCSSPAGYSLIPRNLSGWHMSGEGFCVLDAKGLEPLLSTLKRRAQQTGTGYLYLPLAVHVESGCVFFLAGKSLYEDVYERAATKAAKDAYDSAGAPFCFDYLRVNKAFWGEAKGAANGPFRLRPTFHQNADKSYDTVLNDFKRYCVVGVEDTSVIEEERRLNDDTEGVIERVRGLNEDAPAGTADAFFWAFYPPEEPEPGRSGRDAFYQERDRAPRSPGGLLV